MAEVAPFHLVNAVAQELYFAAGGNSSWHLLPFARRTSYLDMADAAIQAAGPYLRRQARAELLEELVDETIAQAGDIRDRLALAVLLMPSDDWPPLYYARTLYRRAKEERRGR